jgi:hypothetical protein
MKKIIGKFALENVDVQAIEVPVGSEFLSVVAQVDQVGIVGANGQKHARVIMNLFIGSNPEVEEKEKFKIYICGLNVENEIPETAKFVGVCPVMNGQLVFHIYVDKFIE